MRSITAPIISPQQVYQACINGVSDRDSHTRFSAVSNNIVVAAVDYQQKAIAKQLYTIPANDCADNDVVMGAVTKKELKTIYNLYMVKANKPARPIYDSLLSSAPLGRCPLCGMGYASTLDHYLPKSKFPQLSVTPLNLVPACKDCNKEKKTAFSITAEGQSLHPYFDHDAFINDQWLYASVEETTPAVILFFVQPPDHWDNISKERVQSHFTDFKLDLRYSIEASNHLACLRNSLFLQWDWLGFVGVKQQLMIEALGHFQQHANSWQTAMLQALAKSDWYCNGGFQ